MLVPPSVSVRSGLFREANSSWPESLHTVHIITSPMQTRSSVPVIYCRVEGEETRKQGRDAHEEEEEKRRRAGGIEVSPEELVEIKKRIF